MQLPLSLLLSAASALSAALPARSAELTTENFTSSVANGLWFIEFFSPYCGHCTAFAPTWEKLVESAAADVPNVKLAQVNCIVHGDLCNDNNVLGYPTLAMYNNGAVVEKFKTARDLPALQAFVKRHADALAPVAQPKLHVNPDGQVLDLTEDTFQETLSQGPMFVKFFAPWCGHCKKLAPIWKQLAQSMQNKLAIAEVNCDNHNALCKSNDVQGYPTLVYFGTDGLKSVYSSGRKLDQLQAFVERAASAGIIPFKTQELEKLVQENQVLYLLLHAGADNAIVETARKAAAPLLGSPMIFSSSDPSLFTRFSIPQTSKWALIALKDHDAETPASIHHERESSEEQLDIWLKSHRIPTTLELTQDTFQSVMNAPQAPLVVIAAVAPANRDQVVERFTELGQKWRLRTHGNGLSSGREVVFAWMDAERWKDWMKSMYGIQPTDVQAAGLEGVRVIITDHKELIYWDKDPSDVRINAASTTSVFAAVEAAAAGKLSYKHSENYAERLARYLNQKMVSIETYVTTYPGRAIFYVVVLASIMFYVLKRLVADDVGDYRKVDRLD